MAAIRHEARGAAREPDGGTPGRPGKFPETAWERMVRAAILYIVGVLSGSCRVALPFRFPHLAPSIDAAYSGNIVSLLMR
jgi:hypothetical protein